MEELFAFLICKGDATRDEIADTLWPGLSPDRALKNINSNLYYIRKALQPYGLDGCVCTRHRQIVVDTGKISCDLYKFEALQRLKKLSEEEWERLNGLYAGDLFHGKNYEWSFPIGRGLENRFVSVLLRTARQREEQERQAEAEALYLRALDLDFYEEAYDRLIAMYWETRQLRKAEHLIERMEKLFKDERV